MSNENDVPEKFTLLSATELSLFKSKIEKAGSTTVLLFVVAVRLATSANKGE